MSSIHRPETARLGDGRRLSISDLQALKRLIPGLADSFVRNETYALNEHQAYGLLQHYGLSTSHHRFHWRPHECIRVRSRREVYSRTTGRSAEPYA